MNSAPQQPILSPERFAQLRDLVASYSGVYLDGSRQRVLEAALAQRLAAIGGDLLGYERFVFTAAGQAELQQLAELVLNHETFFFRNQPHVRALREVLLAELHQRKPANAPLRIWSAGCASGEEAYSLAILALETLGPASGRPIEIWATDLSEAALARATTGYYHGRALVQVPPEWLARYFSAHGRGYLVNAAVRRLVRFERLNLLDPLPTHAQSFDIIFCQNVLIYFQLETCRRILASFYERLHPDGLLFLGFSETLWNIYDRFRSREVAGAYVYYKEAYNTRTPAAAKATPGTSRAGTIHGSGVTPVPRRALEHDTARQPAAVTLLRRSQHLLAQGQAEAAIEVLGRLTPHSPQAPQALVLAARCHADRGELDLAVAEVQRALEIDALIEEAYILLGAIYSQQGQWDLAVQQLERARYLNPSAPLVSFHLAEAYRQSGRAVPAAREYRSTLRKLLPHPPDTVLEGVAVGWLRESCQRQLEQLTYQQ